jgi:hypothetical protein
LGSNRIDGRQRIELVIGMIGQGVRDNQQGRLVNCQLGLVVLVKALVATVFHDPQVGVGEVILVGFTDGQRGGAGTRPLGWRPVCWV